MDIDCRDEGRIQDFGKGVVQPLLTDSHHAIGDLSTGIQSNVSIKLHILSVAITPVQSDKSIVQPFTIRPKSLSYMFAIVER